MKEARRTPIINKPLRHPGKSLERRLNEIIDDEVILYVLAIGIFSMLTVSEWIHYYSKSKPLPWLMTITTIIVLLYSIYKLYNAKEKTKNIILGIEGERVVGQCLENLRQEGCRVYHDIEGEDFNIDHVVISKKGIYAIETKTYRKPAKGEPKIYYDGKRISEKDKWSTDKPIKQARAEARWLSNLITSLTGHDYAVKPVVVITDWFVESSAEGKKSDTWVLNQNALIKYINKESAKIPIEEVSLISTHLESFIRKQ